MTNVITGGAGRPARAGAAIPARGGARGYSLYFHNEWYA